MKVHAWASSTQGCRRRRQRPEKKRGPAWARDRSRRPGHNPIKSTRYGTGAGVGLQRCVTHALTRHACAAALTRAPPRYACAAALCMRRGPQGSGAGASPPDLTAYACTTAEVERLRAPLRSAGAWRSLPQTHRPPTAAACTLRECELSGAHAIAWTAQDRGALRHIATAPDVASHPSKNPTPT